MRSVINIDELRYHSLRGSIFESFVWPELYKSYRNGGLIPDIYFWRDVKNHEVDFILDRGCSVLHIEVKSGATISLDNLKGLQLYCTAAGQKSDKPVLHCSGNDN